MKNISILIIFLLGYQVFSESCTAKWQRKAGYHDWCQATVTKNGGEVNTTLYYDGGQSTETCKVVWDNSGIKFFYYNAWSTYHSPTANGTFNMQFDYFGGTSPNGEITITGLSGGSYGYEVTVNISPEGSGAVTGDGHYDSGDPVTLSALPAQYYVFDHWSTPYGDSNPFELTSSISQNYTLTAYFIADPSTNPPDNPNDPTGDDDDNQTDNDDDVPAINEMKNAVVNKLDSIENKFTDILDGMEIYLDPLNQIETDVSSIKTNTDNMGESLANIEDGVLNIDTNVGNIYASIETIRQDVGGIKTYIQETNSKLDTISETLTDIKESLQGEGTAAQGSSVVLPEVISQESINSEYPLPDPLQVPEAPSEITGLEPYFTPRNISPGDPMPTFVFPLSNLTGGTFEDVEMEFFSNPAYEPYITAFRTMVAGFLIYFSILYAIRILRTFEF